MCCSLGLEGLPTTEPPTTALTLTGSGRIWDCPVLASAFQLEGPSSLSLFCSGLGGRSGDSDDDFLQMFSQGFVLLEVC